jgi:hypothetical protein
MKSSNEIENIAENVDKKPAMFDRNRFTNSRFS